MYNIGDMCLIKWPGGDRKYYNKKVFISDRIQEYLYLVKLTTNEKFQYCTGLSLQDNDTKLLINIDWLEKIKPPKTFGIVKFMESINAIKK